MKHTSWLSGFSAVRRPSATCSIANLCLGEVPDRKHGSPQFALREHVHHVALILGGISTAMHEASIADDVDTCVVTRRDGIESQQIGALAEPVELQVSIAFDARVRREAFAVSTHVGIDDVGVEIVAEVEHEMVDVQLLCDTPGVVDIGDRTAAGIALAAPQAHRDTDDVVTGIDQFGGGNR